MKIGDLVYATFEKKRPLHKRGLGVVAAIEPRQDPGKMMGEETYRVFWLDEDEPAWYYEHEVESVDETR